MSASAYAPVSPAYSTVSSDFGKLRHIVNLLTPGLVFAADGARYGRAIEAVVPPGWKSASLTRPRRGARRTPLRRLAGDSRRGRRWMPRMTRSGRTPSPRSSSPRARPACPRASINTQRMLCANQEMLRTHYAFFADEPPVLLDWSPWNHTAGGNNNLQPRALQRRHPLPRRRPSAARRHRGDGAQPARGVADLVLQRAARLSRRCIPFLRRDEALRRSFFSAASRC